MNLLEGISEISFYMRLLREVQETGTEVGNLSSRDIILIELLNKKGKMGFAEIGQYFGSAATSTISTYVSGLWKKGYVEKTLDPSNPRARLISLTENGRQLLNNVKKASAKRLGFLLDNTTKKEREALKSVIEKALMNLNKEFREISENIER